MLAIGTTYNNPDNAFLNQKKIDCKLNNEGASIELYRTGPGEKQKLFLI